MKITNEFISLVGYVVANNISDAAENFQNDIKMYDTVEDARDSWAYQEVEPSKIYKIETRISEH